MSPWHNRIARLPPKEQVTGSIPVGDTIKSIFRKGIQGGHSYIA